MQEIYSSKDSKHQPQDSKKLLSRQILDDIRKELRKYKNRPLLGISIYPNLLTFETQEESEEIIFLLRKHFITNVPWIVMSFIMLLAPLILPFVPLVSFLPGSFQIMTLVVWYLVVLAYVLESFLSWYFNIYIITDERLIDIDFYSLIYKRISETKIDRIQDVTYTQGGFFQSMLNYGSVTVQTAGEVQQFDLELVPQPSVVAKTLNHLVMEEEQEKIEGRIN